MKAEADCDINLSSQKLDNKTIKNDFRGEQIQNGLILT